MWTVRNFLNERKHRVESAVTWGENWAFIAFRYKSYRNIGMTTGSCLLWLPSAEHGRKINHRDSSISNLKCFLSIIHKILTHLWIVKQTSAKSKWLPRARFRFVLMLEPGGLISNCITKAYWGMRILCCSAPWSMLKAATRGHTLQLEKEPLASSHYTGTSMLFSEAQDM